MLKDIHNKSEIKAVLDHQLVNLRTYNIDPRALSHDKAGLRSTYSFEKAGNSRRSDEMLKTGQVPMDVNAMPGLVLEESDDEEKDIWGDVNAMQGGEACYFCKKTKHQKRDCWKYKEWKKKNPDRKYGSSNRKPIFCYNCGKDGQISRECRGEGNNWRKDNGAVGGGQLAEMAKSMVEMQRLIIKLAPDAVFP